MNIRESVKREIDTLSNDMLYVVRDFLLFQKYRDILEMDDAAYLNAIPGMADSIKEGIETPLSECVPLSNVWADV
jgi:hypothetical protein